MIEFAHGRDDVMWVIWYAGFEWRISPALYTGCQAYLFAISERTAKRINDGYQIGVHAWGALIGGWFRRLCCTAASAVAHVTDVVRLSNFSSIVQQKSLSGSKTMRRSAMHCNDCSRRIQIDDGE